MNKTTSDAVIHYCGKWPKLSYGKNWIVYRNSDGFENWSLWDDGELNETWQRVCTREQFEQHTSHNVNTEGMQGDVKEFYKDGQHAKHGDKNPYNRLTQVRAFHSWSAGYCDKHGELPK